MKKAITLILGIIISSSYAQDEHWERLTQEVSGDTIDKVYFINEQHGVIVKKLGTSNGNRIQQVYHSNDSGRTWTLAQIDDRDRVNFGNSWGVESIYHSDANTVWIVGGNRVFKSVDRGRNWEIAVTLEGSAVLRTRKIFFPAPSIGYFFTADWFSTIVGKTTDGGINWSLSQINDLRVNDAFFLNADTGWVVGSPYNDCLRKTINGGITWENMRFNAEQYETEAVSVFFASYQVGWIGGYNEFLAGTKDGGNTWAMLRNGPHYMFMSKIHFINENVGWAFLDVSFNSRGILMNTIDGGKSWEQWWFVDPQFGTATTDIRDFHFNSVNGWLVGERNTLLRTSNYGGLEEYISVKPSLRPKKNQTQTQLPLIALRGKTIDITIPKNSEYQIRIVSMRGRTIARFKAASENNSFPLVKIPAGRYVVEIRGRGGFKTTSAIVVRK
jgi:photosystem II stability/assembly factor-like uncharacterized protein